MQITDNNCTDAVNKNMLLTTNITNNRIRMYFDSYR
jgi:hypothetical protein